MVTKRAVCTRFEDSADFSHHKRLIRVRDRDVADQAVERSRSQRHLFCLSQDNRQVASSTIRERVRIDVQSNGHASPFCELLEFFSASTPDIDHKRSRSEWRLCVRQDVRVPGKCRRIDHAPNFRRPICQRQDFGQ
jgi:hypothetical protein